MTNALLQPVSLGDFQLPNRAVMAPLTRCRSSEGRVPNALMAEYYAQRASFGLIITEATSINADGVGYPDTPGIWSEQQIAGWKQVTDAVHQAGGQIICQLWHVGRISHPTYLEGRTPLSASAIKPAGYVSLLRPKTEFVTPQAMTKAQIKQTIADYRQAAINAKKAGFDGVELHGANGYLVDQFLQSSTNTRDDEYGGLIENRVRFMLEAVDELIDVWGSGRVGVHLAPQCDTHDMGDADPDALFAHVGQVLGERQIAFICTREGEQPHARTPLIKKHFDGPVIGNQSYTPDSARDAIERGEVQAIAFGQLAISNPDLTQRVEAHADLNEPNPATYYQHEDGKPEQGYTDYPTLNMAKNTLKTNDQTTPCSCA